jgi:hypothetical protein
MKNNPRTSLAAALSVLIFSTPVAAHHGAADYDMAQVFTVNGGTVTNFEFVNPHMHIYFQVTDEKGNVQDWVAEGTSPNVLYRSGWSKDSLKPGTKLQSVSGNRAKDGRFSMRIRKIVLADGEELPIPQ